MSLCKDLLNQKFGQLTVVQKLKMNNHREMEWLCVCDCGREHISTSNRLTRGQTTCCKECMKNKISISNTKHSCKPEALWCCYQNMKTRCYNKKYSLYHRYGGRGISVCEEWYNSFVSFRDWAFNSGWEEGLSLDRIDNNGNYCPENCKWSTVQEQSNNRHTNRILTANGVSDTMANWSRKLNIPYYVIQYRLEKGWDDAKTLTTPYKRRKNDIV